MSKHTQGKWYIDLVQIDKSWLKGRLQECVMAGDKPVAICSDNLANARLIAAAPDMLAMLKECFEVIDRYTDGHDEIELAGVLAPLETLINKIEG